MSQNTDSPEAHRAYLFSIAYRMLGEVAEAEDMVQDVFLHWLQRETEGVANPKSYLARMTVNRCINRLAELKQKRESYTGPWLPEPVISSAPADNDTAEPLDYGMLFMLERLNPRERAVFILRNSFDYSYTDIASFTGETEANCRQLLHRATEKLDGPLRQKADRETHQRLLEAFMVAVANRDHGALIDMLTGDIVLISDGGGKRAAAIKPIHGPEKIIKFFFGVAQLTSDIEFEFQPVFAGQQPAARLVVKHSGETDSVFLISVRDGKIAEIFGIRNPDKL